MGTTYNTVGDGLCAVPVVILQCPGNGTQAVPYEYG